MRHNDYNVFIRIQRFTHSQEGTQFYRYDLFNQLEGVSHPDAGHASW